MRLKRLEIKGFKSFANNTVIHFNENITGIVGPNGSGKSNIVDAIRWVLGEQKSTELRLDKMSSIIFNGTKKRKPSGMAQVSLIFENTKNILPVEYNEVSVSRLLFNTGDSEYRLNDVPCRLKDIYTLFADTGIGSNTYAIIGFGMVEEILNNKDHNRRTMIEQAAGISKFKVRKKETLQRLQSATENLNRVQDRLAEIEANLSTLKRQANRAEKWLEIKKQYKALATQVFELKSANTRDSIIELEAKWSEIINEVNLADQAILRAEADLEEKKLGLITKEQSLSTAQKSVNSQLENLKDLESKREVNKQRIHYVTTRSEEAGAEITKLNVRHEELINQRNAHEKLVPQYHAELEKLQLDSETANQRVEQLKQELAELEQTISPFSKDNEQIRALLFDIEKENAMLQAQINSTKENAGRNQSRLVTMENDLKGLATSQSTLSSQKSKLEEELSNKTAALDKLKLQHEEAVSDLSHHKEQKAQLEKQLDMIHHESKILRALIENNEGYPEAAKFLSKNSSNYGTFPVLAEVFDIDEAYKPALENFLKEYLTYFVVPTYVDAMNLVNVLTDTQKGKCGFFVLESYENDQTPLYHIEDKLSLASLVRYEKKYKALANTLLANAYIISNEQLGQKPKGNEVFLTLDGSVQIHQGRVFGGSIGLIETNLLGRKKRLENLEEEHLQIKHDHKDILVKITQSEDSTAALHQQIVEVNTQNTENQLRLIAEQINQITYKSENLNLQIDTLMNDNSEGTKLVENLQGKVDANHRKSEELKFRLGETESALATEQGKQKKVSDEYHVALLHVSDARMHFIQQQNKNQNLDKEIENLKLQITGINAQIENNRQVSTQSIHEIASLNNLQQELEQKIFEINELFKGSQHELTSVERAYFEERKKIVENEDQIKNLHRQRNNHQEIANKRKDSLQSLNYELTRLADNFKIEFGELEAIEDQVKIEGTLDEMEQKLQKLKNTIAQFGEVNPLALQAYQEIKERYDDIIAQQKDILESKENLLATLKELEDTSTKKFMEAFIQVRENFKMVFRSLFTADDDCDLVIEDEQNVLEADINVIAKPKGKRPQSLSQLSGGEKTLTAIAFLFSLYLLKPAPFCIFDELDAPLDDINVEKLNKIIDQFSEESQFIIITHNKLTMASMDTLYGVYMEEQGVSGLSQVDFRSFDHEYKMEQIEG